ncbi:unnamed protein product [Allacma fusca]|uniref:CRAL-TRIO domain-containing protein n=1 Tax=Allacma fusca TaxID=39272 RepID=A0A8J2PHD5_9HEXA|nr:unnamed protein product [Allacma fusca]
MAGLGATIEELKKVSEFRAIVGKIYPKPDEKLLMWLRARDLDLVKAEKMLRRHLLWRRNNEIEELQQWRSPKVFFPYVHIGFDKESSPVYLMPIGRWDIRSVIELGDIVPAVRFIYQTLEHIISSTNSKGIYQGTVICDFDGFGYRQIAHRSVLQGMLDILLVFEANYPEVLKVAYVINAPRTFNYLFTLAKPLMNSRTLGKVQIFGPNRQKWQEVLLKYIDADQIPRFWGGTKPGRDEFCSDDWFLEPLPPNYFRRKDSCFDEYGEEWSTIKVPARDKIRFDYVVKPGEDSILKWEFKTEGYDIGFSIYYGDEEYYPVKYQRVNSHLQNHHGFFNADRPGNYTVEFDNTYSRTRAKTLNCSIGLCRISPPDFNFNEISLNEADT